jgi:predicted Zn finger-like uncharacterized protein
MALATRCPNCHALFRVVADQLKLRGGLVRCGACRHVFDAIGTLSYIDDALLAAAPPAAAGAATTASTTMAVGKAATTLVQAATSGPAAAAGEPAEHAAIEAYEFASESQLGADADAEPPVAPGREDGDDRAAMTSVAGDAGESATAAQPAEAPEVSPTFLQAEEPSRQRRGSIAFGSGAVLLALLALAQVTVLYRAEILAAYPLARPALTQLCRAFGCTVDWPARSALLAVVGSELQALPGTSALELTAVVRNRGNSTLALPAIELTLTDTFNRTVARKVFAPADYLAGAADAAARMLAGLEAGADLTIRVGFEARGLNAAGFVVYPFYL